LEIPEAPEKKSSCTGDKKGDSKEEPKIICEVF